MPGTVQLNNNPPLYNAHRLNFSDWRAVREKKHLAARFTAAAYERLKSTSKFRQSAALFSSIGVLQPNTGHLPFSLEQFQLTFCGVGFRAPVKSADSRAV